MPKQKRAAFEDFLKQQATLAGLTVAEMRVELRKLLELPRAPKFEGWTDEELVALLRDVEP